MGSPLEAVTAPRHEREGRAHHHAGEKRPAVPGQAGPAQWRGYLQASPRAPQGRAHPPQGPRQPRGQHHQLGTHRETSDAQRNFQTKRSFRREIPLNNYHDP